ncbi:MAG: nitroreductase [Deltaproteobacteria bacterium]|nr:nitroreductase [Deltaproteobacteria bacterium]
MQWKILDHAAMAPSGHNTQPWTISAVEPERWVLGSAPARWLPAVDPTNRETLLSLGAFLENLVQAAESQGFGVDYRVVARTARDAEVVDLRLKPGAPRDHDLSHLRGRRTIRKGMQPASLAKEDVDYLLQHDPGSFLVFPRGSREAALLAAKTLEANRLQAERSAAQAELADWIRWSDADVERHRDGLSPATMEIEGLAGWYVRTFYDRSNVLTPAFRRRTVELIEALVQEGGGWILKLSADEDPGTLIEAGRSWERMFLRCRSRNVALHPMTQALEEPSCRDDLTRQLGLRRPVQFILRVGYRTPYPEPVSPRRPAAWFLKEART